MNERNVEKRIELLLREYSLLPAQRSLNIFPDGSSCVSTLAFVLGLSDYFLSPTEAFLLLKKNENNWKRVTSPSAGNVLLTHIPKTRIIAHAGIHVDESRVFHQRYGGGDVCIDDWTTVSYLYHKPKYYVIV